MSDEFGHLRLGDEDRLHVLNELGEHFAAGRLDSMEFDDLSGRVAVVKTLGELDPLFEGLPGGVPLTVVGDRVVRRSASQPDSDGLPAESGSGEVAVPGSAEAELKSLRKRGQVVESMDAAIFGITLVSFLVLQFVVGWSWAWIVWPSLALTLTLPRAFLNYSDEDEELYAEIKETESEARKERLTRAAERIRELEEGKREEDKPGETEYDDPGSDDESR